MKKKWIIPAAAAMSVCIFASACSLPKKNTVDQSGKTVYPVSTYDETLPVTMGDVMPFFDDGVMNIYHLQNTSSSSLFYHPIARLTTSDYVNYTDCGVSINYETEAESPDAALGTGSFIKDKEGVYHCFYTGHNANHNGKLPWNEVVRHAVSYDGQATWQKVEDFNLYGQSHEFRDPYVYYDGEDDRYYMLVTTEQGGSGVIKRYGADSLNAGDGEWQDLGVFFYNDDGNYIMECPSYVEYNGYYYLAYSEQGANRVTHYRYKSEKDGEWKRFSRDAIDGTGFYAGRLEKGADGLYAFAWCAELSGGSTGGFDWGGNLVAHKLTQKSDGELCPVLISSVKDAFSTQVRYKFSGGDLIEEAVFSGEGFSARCVEKLGRGVTRMRFNVTPQNYGGDFGLSFGLDGVYQNRLGQAIVCFDAKGSRLACYNNVSSIIRYGDPLASVDFAYSAGKTYGVDIIIDGEILTVYLDGEVALTARFPGIQRRNFAFYSNGGAVDFKEIAFYE